MIEVDSEDAEDLVISQNSPEDKNVCDEHNIITDFSSPMKADQETITDVSSPEISLSKVRLSVSQCLKRKRKSYARRSLNLSKRPSLSINISRKSSPIIQKKEECKAPAQLQNCVSDSSNEEEIEGDFTGSKEKEFCELTSPFHGEGIEENIDDVMSQTLQIEENSPDEVKSCCSVESFNTSVSGENDNQLFQHSPLVDKNRTYNLDCSSSTKHKPKKGSLLEKAVKVDSLMKKEAILYEHELSVGLRTFRGSFVSDILTVKTVYPEETFNVLECVPHCYDLNSSSYKNDQVGYIFIMVSSLVNDLTQNCSIVVHFPVITIFDVFLKSQLIFANDRVQVVPKNITQSCSRFGDVNFSVRKRNIKMFRSLKSRCSKNILDAVLSHLLVHEHTLQLEILHIHKKRVSERKCLRLMAADSEKQFCIVQLKYFDQIEKSLNIVTGSVFTFVGFTLTGIYDLNYKVKHAAEYYSSGPIENDFLYVLEPARPDWSIKFLRKQDTNKRYGLVAWHDVMHQNIDERKRFKLLISEVKIHKNDIYVKEQSANQFLSLNLETQNKGIFSHLKNPFMLEGVYLNQGKLGYDEFSRIEPLQG